MELEPFSEINFFACPVYRGRLVEGVCLSSEDAVWSLRAMWPMPRVSFSFHRYISADKLILNEMEFFAMS